MVFLLTPFTAKVLPICSLREYLGIADTGIQYLYTADPKDFRFNLANLDETPARH